jgi:outer membrane protein OmpA-like peptidoglycan-associated protein
MNRIRLFVPVVPAMAALVAACETVPPPASPQLMAAREEYKHAARGPAGWDAPSALNVASASLTHAQKANDISDEYATDYAELARSRAELADRHGNAVVAARDLDRARNELLVAQTEQLRGISQRLGAAEMQGPQGQPAAVISAGLLFKTNSAELEPGVKRKLEHVAQILASNPQVNSVVVEGYTDDVGTPQLNESLSETRAESVSAYLETHGISRDRISTRALSSENPVASNKTSEGRAMNRRVEIRVNAAPAPAGSPAPQLR